MRAIVTLPDEIFAATEELAGSLGVSRSQLYCRALTEFIARRHDDDVTRRLNEVYGEIEARLDPLLGELQLRSITTTGDRSGRKP